MAKYVRMRDLREDKDLSQQECAKILDLHLTTYKRYERGERDVPFRIAIRMADFYNVSLDFLAGRTNNPKAPEKN